ncbi:hypothetical protein [Maribacter sp. R77961]|uniref:hypothetical protein n=1 Tax=Maribacter sp. R77961 TaxID=3093871 RepID=UPI0037CAF0BF
MTDKKINRYTNVELLYCIKTEKDGMLVDSAKTELRKRNLSDEELGIAESEYLKYQQYAEKRKDEPLTRDEWFSFFFLPFVTPSPSWRENHFSASEYERFEKYGFRKKAKQATEVKQLGCLFWAVVIIIGLVVRRFFNL